MGFKNLRKYLIKKIIQGKDVSITNVLSCYGHLREVLVWKIFTENHIVKTLKKHQNSPTGTHKNSQILLIRFLDEYRVKEVVINKVFDSTHKENIRKARKAITPIVDTLKLCGHQNIPLRGHKYSTKNHPEVGKSGLTNSGDFVELLMYRVRGGDKTLENHLQNAPRNAKYTSPDIQNELIECCRDLIVEQLVGEVKESRYY